VRCGATSGEDAPEIVTVYAVFGSAEEAQRIARTLVEERLAACANILAPGRSVYRWQGKIEAAQEVPALFKTRAEQAEPLIARIAELHSYELPAAVAWPTANALRDYAEWVDRESRE
jgi:periplasmic divalent cation tolerance protein